MSSRHPKPGANKPHQAGTQHDKCDVTGSIHVRGEIETTVPPDFAKKRDVAEEKQEARDKLRFRVEVTGLVFVIIYAGLTAWQGWSSQKATNAAKNAADTAHDALVLDERPWVGTNNHLSVQIVKGSPIKIHLEIQNFGKSPAFNEASFNNVTDRPINVPMPKFVGYSRSDAGPTVTLMPNSIASVDINTAKPSDNYGESAVLKDIDIQRLNSGQVQLFLYGSIWYDDTFGKSHRTDYCLQYIPSISNETGSKFGACLAHNYAD